MFTKAFAKINIYLDVLSKRDDGYHNLEMVMLPIALHDSIFFDILPYAPDSYVTFDHVELLAAKSNLVVETINEMRQRFDFNKNFSVSVHKEIPINAGLAGGSANSAAVINAIDRVCKLGLSKEEKIEVGKSLGADVPFCLFNKPAHVEGIGEKLDYIKLKKRFYVLIVKPKKGLSTKEVFDLSDTIPLRHGNCADVIKALETDDEELLANSAFNALEDASIKLVPEIENVKQMLHYDGFNIVLMSGSGSSVFALTHDKKLAKEIFKEYEKKGLEVYLTTTL